VSVATSLDDPAAESRSGPLREAFGSLTTRGRGFLAGGLAAAVCGFALGERDLVRIGMLALLIPLVAAFWIAKAGNRLGLLRTLDNSRIQVTHRTPVHLELTNIGQRTGMLLAEEQIPWALGTRPRFVIEAMRGGERRAVEYTVGAEQRGLYKIGPLRVRVSDPTGMAEIDSTFLRTAELVVIPATEPIPSIPLYGGWTGTGDNRPIPFAGGSAADVTVREYRQGDEVRRVHWPSSARTGKLMVRSEEQPWQSRCTLLIDNRAGSHRGHGPDSSLERAITAAASIAAHLVAHGYQVRLVSAQSEHGEAEWHDDTAWGVEPILEQLAVLPSTKAVHLHDDWFDDAAGSGMVVAVVGSLDDHDRALLGRIRQRGRSAYCLAMDVDGWQGRNADVVGSRSAETAHWLRHHGWRTAVLPRGGSVAASWQEMGR